MSKKSTGSSLPLFAQPLNGSKFPMPLQATKKPGVSLWSRPLALSVAVVTCGALLALARPDSAQNMPGTRSGAPAAATSGGASRLSQPASSRTSRQSSSTPTVDPLADMRDESRRSVDFYTEAVRSNMFTAPQPPAPPAPKVVAEAPAPKPLAPVVVPPAEINPFADWSYTGTMTSGDQTTALIENTKTKEGQFVKAGDSFMGSQVTAITDQQIVLQSGKMSRTLAKSDNITVTPLDRSAIPSNAQGQAQPGQGQPNAQQLIQQAIQMQMSNMGNMQRGNRGRGGNGADGAQFSLPNGRTFNAQQWQGRSQRMNQNFNQ